MAVRTETMTPSARHYVSATLRRDRPLQVFKAAGVLLAARIRGSETDTTTGDARGTQLVALSLLLPAFHAALLASGFSAPAQQAAAGLWLLTVLLLLGSLTVVYLRRVEQVAWERAPELQLAHASPRRER